MDNDFYERLKNVFKTVFALNFFPQLVYDFHFICKLNTYIDPIHTKELTVALMLSKLYPDHDELFWVMYSYQCSNIVKQLGIYAGLSKNKSDFLAFWVRALIRSGSDICHSSTMILVLFAYFTSAFGQSCENQVVYQLSKFC
jgi:hypothetical protein